MTSLTDAIEEDQPEPIRRLSRDLLEASRILGPSEVRYLVDGYYSIQDYRKASNNQVRSAREAGEPGDLLTYLAYQAETVEGQIKRSMQAWVENRRVGRWLLDQKGIGPVLAAGLLAHIDITKCACAIYREMDPIPAHDCPGLKTVSHIWSFAGLTPDVVWEKGQKRPWNADLKTLCWKIGQSFIKVSGYDDAVYGRAYRMRKEYELRLQGSHPEQVEQALTRKLTENQKTWYDRGMLPPGRIDLRAQRWTVKLFLSHLQAVLYEDHYGVKPPKPYVIDRLGHTDYLGPPNWPRD